MTRTLRGCLLALGLGLSGCGTLADNVPYEHHLPSRKTATASVEILARYPEKTYVEVAKVEAFATSMWGTRDDLEYALRQEAARIGADAIVNVQPPDQPADTFTLTGITWVDYVLRPARRLSGIAIRYL